MPEESAPAAPDGGCARRDRALSIVHAIARLNVGGAALNVLGLAAEQRRRGHDVVVVAGTLPTGEASMEYVAAELGVPVLHVSALQREISVQPDLTAIHALRRIITTRRPDILHTQTAKAGATGRISRRQAAPARAGRCTRSMDASCAAISARSASTCSSASSGRWHG